MPRQTRARPAIAGGRRAPRSPGARSVLDLGRGEGSPAAAAASRSPVRAHPCMEVAYRALETARDRLAPRPVAAVPGSSA